MAMPQVYEAVSQLRQCVTAWKAQGLSVGFVPTMGNLHAGHYTLVSAAKQTCDRVIVSIFVNPTQFGANEDLATYPRTFTADCAGLSDVAADAVFYPAVSEMYPFGVDNAVKMTVPSIADTLCGLGRPGHFDGVATVVCRLFNQVQADVAFFGKKDYQQWRLIERMVADLAMPIEIVGVDIVREQNGLAMSSRNGYLSQDQQKLAASIYAVLRQIAVKIQQQELRFEPAEKFGMTELSALGFDPEYVSIRDPQHLQLPQLTDRAVVILIAAKLGAIRLIDNLEVDLA